MRSSSLRDALRGVDVVVDHEHFLRRLRLGRSRGDCRAATARGLGQRQADGELAAAAQAVAFDRDAAAVHLDQLADDGQADAQAALRAIERLIDLREQLEDARQHLGGNADAGVLHLEHRLVVGTDRRGR